jgi:hypothetical protein
MLQQVEQKMWVYISPWKLNIPSFESGRRMKNRREEEKNIVGQQHYSVQNIVKLKTKQTRKNRVQFSWARRMSFFILSISLEKIELEINGKCSILF